MKKPGSSRPEKPIPVTQTVNPQAEKIRKQIAAIPQQKEAIDAPSAVTAAKSMTEQDRMVWNVFFTLYKNYAGTCSKFWFNHQLLRMHKYVTEMKSPALLDRLNNWMHAINIEPTEIQKQCSKCVQFLATVPDSEFAHLITAGNKGNETPMVHFHFHNDEHKCHSSCGHQGSIKGSEKMTHEEFANAVTDNGNGCQKPNMAYVHIHTGPLTSKEPLKIDVSPKFTEIFGWSQKDYRSMLERTGGGFLPWSSDIMSPLFVEESDLFQFTQIMAIKFGNLKNIKVYPSVRKVPSCHVFLLKVAGSSKPVECMVKCTHKELLDVELGISSQIYAEFEVMGEIIKDIPEIPYVSTAHIKAEMKKLTDSPSSLPSSPGNSFGLDSDEAAIQFLMADTSLTEQERKALGAEQWYPNDFLSITNLKDSEKPDEDTPLVPILDDEEWLDGLLDWANLEGQLNY